MLSMIKDGLGRYGIVRASNDGFICNGQLRHVSDLLQLAPHEDSISPILRQAEDGICFGLGEI